MSYNLFLDDIREPYIDPKFRDHINKQDEIGQGDLFAFVSAYEYTKYEPFRTEKWVVVRTHKEFIKMVEGRGVPNIVAFDHDLGDEHYPGFDKTGKNTNIINYEDFQEKTGYDSAKWLCDYCQEHGEKFPEYIVHSWNSVGSQNIINYIENYKKHVENE